jgi:hypothetical protein
MSRRLVTLALLPLVTSCGAPQSHAPTSELASESSASPSPSPRTSSSSAPPSLAGAREAFRSDDYRFTLELPATWQPVPPEQTTRLHRDTRTAFATPDGNFIGSVVVSPMPRSITFEAAADRWASSLRGDQGRVVGVDRTRFNDHDAVRARIEMSVSGSPIRIDAMVFLRDRHLVAVQTARTAAASVEPEAFFGAYHELPGALTTRDVDIPITNAEGAGWRIHDRRYEDFAGGLVIEIPAGWSFLDRWSTRDMGADLDVVMRADDDDLYAIVNAEHVPANAQTRWRTVLAAQTAEHFPTASDRPTDTIPFDGAAAEASVHRVGDRELLLANTCHADDCATVGVQYRASHFEAARARMARSFPSMRWMTNAERAAGRRAMPGAVGDLDIVAMDDSFRAGRYTDYAHGIRLVLPESGAWNVQLGHEAKQTNPNLQFAATERHSDMRLALIVESVPDGTSDEVLHRQARDRLHAAPLTGRPRERRIGALHLLESDVESVGDAHISYRIATVVRGTIAVRVEIAGLAENFAANRRMLDTVVRSIEVTPGPIDRARREGERYIADQLGYAVHIPADWTHEQSPLGDGLFADRWAHGERSVFVFAQGPADRPDGVRGGSLLLEILRTLDPTTPAESAWQDGTLAGHPARVATWSVEGRGIRAWRTSSDRTGYIVFATDEPAGSADAVARTFELLR